MKRISTATKVTDKFGDGKHGFRDGDAVAGVLATDLEAELFDHLQEELCSVIEAAGLTVSGAARNQLLLALRAAGVFETPAQFDNTTKAATTAFVQRALGNMSGYRLVGASETIPAGDAGKLLKIGSNNVALVLPATAGLLPGATFNLIIGDNTGVTVNTTGGIGLRVGNALQTLPLALPAVTDLKITWRGDVWEAHGGSGTLKFEPQFASSLVSGGGYTKLPNGLIMQIGTAVISATPGAVNTTTLQVAYPALQCRTIVVNGDGYTTGTNTAVLESGSASLTSFQWMTNASGSHRINFISWGK